MVPRIKNKNIKLGQIGISRRGKKSAKNNHCAAPDPSFSLGLSSFSIPFGEKKKSSGSPGGEETRLGAPLLSCRAPHQLQAPRTVAEITNKMKKPTIAGELF
jgi:hypothetical protein